MPFDGNDQYGVIEKLQILADLCRQNPHRGQGSYATCLYSEARQHETLITLGIRKHESQRLPTSATYAFFGFRPEDFLLNPQPFGASAKVRKLHTIECAIARHMRALSQMAQPAIVRASSLMSVKPWQEVVNA